MISICYKHMYHLQDTKKGYHWVAFNLLLLLNYLIINLELAITLPSDLTFTK